jgi:hypothetical protein
MAVHNTAARNTRCLQGFMLGHLLPVLVLMEAVAVGLTEAEEGFSDALRHLARGSAVAARSIGPCTAYVVGHPWLITHAAPAISIHIPWQTTGATTLAGQPAKHKQWQWSVSLWVVADMRCIQGPITPARHALPTPCDAAF